MKAKEKKVKVEKVYLKELLEATGMDEKVMESVVKTLIKKGYVQADKVERAEKLWNGIVIKNYRLHGCTFEGLIERFKCVYVLLTSHIKDLEG